MRHKPLSDCAPEHVYVQLSTCNTIWAGEPRNKENTVPSRCLTTLHEEADSEDHDDHYHQQFNYGRQRHGNSPLV